MRDIEAVATKITMQSAEATLEGLEGAAHLDLERLKGRFAGVRKLIARLTRLTNAQLALMISAVLFVLGAWPLLLTPVPPYQDLPNHIAAIAVIEHPELYPQFVFNGFFKTNAALFVWLCTVGKLVGVAGAAKLFTVFILGANAWVFPRLVLELTGSRGRMIIASFFIWPMIHNWFVSMGMLDFALAVPLSLLCLLRLARQARSPSAKNGAFAMVLACLTWYVHVFPLMVLHLLLAIEAALKPTWRDRWIELLRTVAPILPASALMLWSLYSHWTEPLGAMTGYVSLHHAIPPWELVYNMWSEWCWGFTWLSITSLVPAIALGVYGFINRREHIPYFSMWAALALLALYAATPYVATNWFHVNSRLLPFIWSALFLRLPERLPRPAKVGLVACALAYTLGMGADFVRLERDREQFTAGMNMIPQHARLLPLIFKQKVTSENTRSLLHAWGWYAYEKQTTMPLLFAHSRSFPVMYRNPPRPQFHQLVLEPFASSMTGPTWGCEILRTGGVVVSDCEKLWREGWAEFWQQATGEFDYVLMWHGSPGARKLVPSEYEVIFDQDHLAIYAKRSLRDAKQDAERAQTSAAATPN